VAEKWLHKLSRQGKLIVVDSLGFFAGRKLSSRKQTIVIDFKNADFIAIAECATPEMNDGPGNQLSRQDRFHHPQVPD